jgi:hypothetical protein
MNRGISVTYYLVIVILNKMTEEDIVYNLDSSLDIKIPLGLYR